MTADNVFPFGLLKANLAWQLQFAQLLHEHGQRWLELAAHISKDDLDIYKTTTAKLPKTEDWQTLALLPAEVFWSKWQQRLANIQSATQVAIEAQAAFMQGLTQTAQVWQKCAMNNAETASVNLPFTEFLKSWTVSVPVEVADKKKAAAVG